MIVDKGKAFVFERISAKIATAGKTTGSTLAHWQREIYSTVDPARFPSRALSGFPNALKRESDCANFMHTNPILCLYLRPFVVLPCNFLQRHPSK